MRKVYEDKGDGIKIFQGENDKFYAKAKKNYTGFFKIFDTYTTVFQGCTLADTAKKESIDKPFSLSQPLAVNSIETAISVTKFLRKNEDGNVPELGMGLKNRILDKIAKVREEVENPSSHNIKKP